MFCMKCGQNLPDDIRFCPHCGQRIEKLAPVVPVQSAEVQETSVISPIQSEISIAEPILPEMPPVEPIAEVVLPEAPAEEPVAEPLQEEMTAADEAAVPVQEIVETEMPEAMVSDAPLAQDDTAPSCTYAPQTEASAEPAPPKKKSKTMLIVTICVAVLVLALVAACALIFVHANAPEARLLRAWDGTMEDLSDITANAETFNALTAQLKTYQDGFTSKSSMSASTNDEDMSGQYTYEVISHRDQVNRRMMTEYSVEIDFSYPEYEEFDINTSTKYIAYMDSECLVLSLPDKLGDSYMIPTDQFGEKLMDSELGDLLAEELDEESIEFIRALDIDLTVLMDPKLAELCPEQYQLFMDSITIEKSEEEIALANDIEQVYEISFDMDALLELLFASAEELVTRGVGDIGDSLPKDVLEDLEDGIEEVRETLEEVEYTILIGVGDGKLKALYIELESEEEAHDLTLVLAGTDNVWEDILVYADGEEVLSGGIVKKKFGFNISLEAEGEKLIIAVDDEDQEIKVKFDGDEVIALTYDADEEGVVLKYEIAQNGTDTSCTIEIGALEEFEAPEDSVDLFSLSEEELEELGEELIEALGFVG